MNPSVERIQLLFAQNDPTNYYWSNFEKFLRGHSYKAVAALLSSPLWTPTQSQTLLALVNGEKIGNWLNLPPQVQTRRLFQTTNIRRSTHYNNEPDGLSPIKFKVLRDCWDACDSTTKFHAWDNWSAGVENVDDVGRKFMLDAMKRWDTPTVADSQLKIQALISSMDGFGAVARSHRNVADGEYYTRSSSTWQTEQLLVALFESYTAILNQEIHKMKGRWDHTIASVQTWRQVQGYPDFARELGTPHPWMQSLCVAHTGSLNRDLPSGLVFAVINDQLKSVRVDRAMTENPLNEHDYPLAIALKQHLSGESVTVAPEVSTLYWMLEGTRDMVDILLSLSLPAQPIMQVDGSMFECTP